jgi:hypothetical protein
MSIAEKVAGLPRIELEPEKKSQAQRLVELVPDAALFRSTDGETAYATLPVDGHLETWPVRSKGFRRWLVGKFYSMANKPPAAQALSDALGALEARRGEPVRWFRGAWLAACKAAGLPDKLFHDFRRTAARDLIAAGLDYKAAMSVTGHRTMSTFLRYQIVDTRQTASALAELQAHRQAKRTRGQGTDTAGRLGHEGLR